MKLKDYYKKRQNGPTPHQRDVEIGVEAAESIIKFLHIRDAEVAPKKCRDHLIRLCLSVIDSDHVFRRARIIHPSGGDRAFGVPLISGEREYDGRPYQIVLTPWVEIARHCKPVDADLFLLLDGYGTSTGDAPLQRLSGDRLRAAFPGLVCLLHYHAVSLAKGGDYNWNTSELGEPDESWHPDNLVKRVRAVRTAIPKLETVREVMHS